MRSSLPEGDSRTGFPPAGLPPLPVPTRAQYRWYFPADYSACVRQSLRDMAHSRLTARLPPPALNFFSASAGCIPSVRSVQSARSAATASHCHSKPRLLEIQIKFAIAESIVYIRNGVINQS